MRQSPGSAAAYLDPALGISSLSAIWALRTSGASEKSMDIILA